MGRKILFHYRFKIEMNQDIESQKFLEMLEGHKGIIYKIVNSYCKDEEDRKDLTQEIIIQLWKSFEKYDDRYKYSTWVYRIALNVSISFYRKEKKRGEISNPLPDNLFSIQADNETEEKDYLSKLLKEFISELKELDRALIILYLDEKSHKEISEILGLTETNVATKIGRIKKLLKQKFSKIERE